MNRLDQKGHIKLIIIIIIIIAAIIGVFLVQQRTNYYPQAAYPLSNNTQPPKPKTKSINSPEDLDKAANDLDLTDLNSFEAELGKNNSDSSTF